MQLDQAFRDLNIVQDFIPVTNSNRPGNRLVATHITIHNTDNDSPGADAAAHARYMKGTDAQARQVSWHYTVDDRVIYQSLPINEVGWHAKQGNSTSIGIEICMHPGMNEVKAYDRAALLVALLAMQNDIAVPGRIVQHHFWTQKHCPRVLRDKPNGWTDFLAKVEAALTQLRSAPRAAPSIVTHAADHDSCEVLNSSAAIGATRVEAKPKAKKKAKPKKKAKAKTKTKAKTKKKSKSKARRTKTRKRPRKT